MSSKALPCQSKSLTIYSLFLEGWHGRVIMFYFFFSRLKKKKKRRHIRTFNIPKTLLLNFMSTVSMLSASGEKKKIKRNPMKEDYHLPELSLYIALLDHPLI